jgi:ORF6N domain
MPNDTTPAPHLPISPGLIERRIHLIRSQKVMLSPDLAELYQVETRALVQAVKRNLDRFPEDFMFQLSDEEFQNLKSQIVISSWGGARRATPYAFTELGVAMLSSVLNSKRAVQMNIVIMRAFVRLREVLATHKDLARKIEEMHTTQKDHAALFSIVVKDIQNLAKSVKREFKKLKSPRRQKPRIGFYTDQK